MDNLRQVSGGLHFIIGKTVFGGLAHLRDLDLRRLGGVVVPVPCPSVAVAADVLADPAADALGGGGGGVAVVWPGRAGLRGRVRPLALEGLLVLLKKGKRRRRLRKIK